MRKIKTLNVCALFLLFGFYGVLNAQDYYGGTNYGMFHGLIKTLKIQPAATSMYSYVKIVNIDGSSAAAYNGISLTSSTKQTGWVSVKNDDKQMVAMLISALQITSVLDIYLSGADLNGFNSIESIQVSP